MNIKIEMQVFCGLFIYVLPSKKSMGGVTILELGLWCLTPLSAIFQLYRGGHLCNMNI